MASALNTNVNGSSGTCREAADWLRGMARAGHDAGGAARGARTTAEASWTGPASEEFRRATENPALVSKGIHDQAGKAEEGLRTFADRLDTVSEKMADARAFAIGARLRIEGPYIIKPQAPAKPAGLTTKCAPGQSAEVVQQHYAQYQAYNADVADYNAKVAAYNQAKRHVEDARKLEEQAHTELRQAMTSTSADLNVGGMAYLGATQAAAYTAIAESGRATQLRAGERLGHTADIFERAALGQIGNLTAAQAATMSKVAEKAGANRDQALKRAGQYEQFVKAVPEDVRTAIAAYPGRGSPEIEKAGHRAVPKLTATGKVLKSLPYVGSGLVIGRELYDAYSGEQTWGKAVVDGGAQIGGAAAGAATFGGVGAMAGPHTAVLGGVVGGVLGAVGGQDVVDFFSGESN